MAGHLTHEADPNYYLTPAESPPSLACEEPADERVEGDGVDFPYFVLCGDRASGKTTILEAITGLSFCRDGVLQTRYPVETVLRRGATPSITVMIKAHVSHSKIEMERLSSLRWELMSHTELSRVMEEAATEMGISRNGEAGLFFNDVLVVTVYSPAGPQLTLVDLPGLVHCPTKTCSANDVAMISDLNAMYMRNPQAILLPVVSVNYPAVNQVVLSLVQKADVDGSRTLGIITQAGHLGSGSYRLCWINLARNNDIFFKHGWHLVRPTTAQAIERTPEQRHEAEQAFFANHEFEELERTSLGIDALRTRLETLLHHHLLQALPSLRFHLGEQLNAAAIELDTLVELIEGLLFERDSLLTRVEDLTRAVKSMLDTIGGYGFKNKIDSMSNYDNMHLLVLSTKQLLTARLASLDESMVRAQDLP